MSEEPIVPIRKDDAVNPTFKGFLNKFPAWMHDVLCTIAAGRMATITSFCDYEACTGDSLTKGQHPKYAYAGDSNPEGATKFVMGSGFLGETLVYRVPGCLWFDPQGKMTFRAQAFHALVEAKHLDTIVMATNTKSDVINLLVKRAIEGDDFLKELPPPAQQAAKDFDFLLEDVRGKGFDFYKQYGVPFSGNYEEDLKKALAIEIGFKNIEAAKAFGSPHDVISVLQIPEGREYYQWNPESKVFASVPPMEYDADPRSVEVRRQEIRTYLAEMPRKWRDLGSKISNGFARLIDSLSDVFEGVVRSVHLSSSSCSDSRTTRSTVAGDLPPLEGTVFRTPGNLWVDPNGELCSEAALYLAFAAMRGEIVTKANEATCGAMTYIYQYNADPEGEGKKLHPVFQALGEAFKGRYEKVVRNGIEYYEGQGLNIKAHEGLEATYGNHIISCLAAQTLWADVTAAIQKPWAPHILSVYQNLPDLNNVNNVLDMAAGRFRVIPPLVEADGTEKAPKEPVRPGAAKGGNPEGLTQKPA